ncbi:MAG: hypothetical protein P0Y53_19195 [Candidatus Pseudobacter hemicellulosilyticus]|uniref:Uncharacterized protein n=1 Tax=Candidatus Pseudobacter hemicellulosilyticus TaxID=3121375 RepID=A0AAJ5WS00_9BACT|nr:MAG: hypothetical protein P0Y53_19195 [Pseudobacter sp.]
MLESLILGVIIHAVILVVFFSLRKAGARAVVADKRGRILLRMPVFFAIFGYAGMLFGLAFFIGPPLSGEKDLLAFIGIGTMMWLLGLACVLFYHNHFVLYDETTIETRSLFGKVTAIRWADIKDAGFISFIGLMTLTSRNGQKVGIHYLLKGIDQFLWVFARKTPWTADAIGFPKRRFW